MGTGSFFSLLLLAKKVPVPFFGGMKERADMKLDIDFSQIGGDVNIRRHGLSQGGIDDAPFSPKVIERVRELAPQTLRFFVQEYFRMMPAVGRYDWSRIDAQLRSLAATGAKPILALTMKPECLYPAIDQAITLPSSWPAWEAFIAEMARHFAADLQLPGLWYEVGNEPDIGETGGCPFLFKPDDYAEFYDRTVRAVLRGDPTAKVGGPALAGFMDQRDFSDGFAAGLRRRHSPLDFFSWHSHSPLAEQAVRKHRACKEHLRGLGEPFASAVTVIDEWNISWVCNSQFGEFLQASYAVDWVGRMLDTDIDMSHYYHVWDMPLHEDKWAPWFSPAGLDRLRKHWQSDYRGLHMLSIAGEPAASFVAFKMLYAMEGRRVAAERPARHLGVLASRQERTSRVLLWNYHDEEIRAETVQLGLRNLGIGQGNLKHYRLGGGTLRDLDCIFLAREGKMRLLAEEAVDSSGGLTKEVSVEPYSVHLLEVAG